MGRSYLFECLKCGYKAKASGGADQGVDVAVQTIVCRDCKRLYDVVSRVKAPHVVNFASRLGTASTQFWKRRAIPGGSPAFESVLNRLPLPGATRVKWIQFKLHCPVSSVHKVQTWTDPGRCPRCGVFLERSALPFRIWE